MALQSHGPRRPPGSHPPPPHAWVHHRPRAPLYGGFSASHGPWTDLWGHYLTTGAAPPTAPPFPPCCRATGRVLAVDHLRGRASLRAERHGVRRGQTPAGRGGGVEPV